ncbi:hypothetical protein H8959_004386 [Pygathrix nigripes]
MGQCESLCVPGRIETVQESVGHTPKREFKCPLERMSRILKNVTVNLDPSETKSILSLPVPGGAAGAPGEGGQGQSQSHPLAKKHCREVSVPVVASPG